MRERWNLSVSRIKIEVREQERLSTAPKVIHQLLEEHPEIVQLVTTSYPIAPHRQAHGNFYDEFVPTAYLNPDFARGEWHQTIFFNREVVAVGSVVDICDKTDCRHTSPEHFQQDLWLWNQWHEGFYLPWGRQSSFIFLDIERHGGTVLTQILNVLRSISSDWYLLDSGGGYHIVIDELVNLAMLPQRYGEIISLFGRELSNSNLEGWGDSLLRNADSPNQILLWCRDVKKEIGHLNEPIYQHGHWVFILDLRHIAHSLDGIVGFRNWSARNPVGKGFRRQTVPERPGGAYLRISPGRYSSSPVLVAQKESGEITLFVSPSYPFAVPVVQRTLL